MILKSHLCGIAVAYDKFEKSEAQREFETKIIESANASDQADWLLNLGSNSNIKNVEKGRYQGSLYSWQKRKIADACEYLRTSSTHKPLIFVATSPGFTDLATERKLISKLTHNLTNGYGCENFVWVREFTERGYPHFHFVADMPAFDVLKLSRYWSGLFDSTAQNSIRLGTAPKCSKCGTKLKYKGQTCYKCGKGIGKVEYYLKGKKMAWYMTKYLSKSIGECEKGALSENRSFRKFAVSQKLAKVSAPVMFEGKEVKDEYGRFQHYRQWVSDDDRYYEQGIASPILTDDQVNKKWRWHYTGFANTHKGLPREWKTKPLKK